MESLLKRKAGSVKENCPHGKKCYRRNPHHFKEYEHLHLLDCMENGFEIPHHLPQPEIVYREQIEILKTLNKSMEIQDESEPSTSKTPSPNRYVKNSSDKINEIPETNKQYYHFMNSRDGNNMKKLWDSNAPYYVFFTKIPKSPTTLKQNNAITFTDLLCPSLGKLKTTLQINFMIDIMWLMQQYRARSVGSLPMTILYGYEFPYMREFMDRSLKHVNYHEVKMKDPFGTHHSKVGIYVYDDDSLRVVVSTANLYYEDWNNYNQGLWISPLCPRLSKDGGYGESPTNFKSDLLDYLITYKAPCLTNWIRRVKTADFSAIKVFLVTSTPGKHYPDDSGSHLHTVANLLKTHCNLPDLTEDQSEGPEKWGVMAQASSIGSLGKTSGDWLRSTFLRSLAAHKNSCLTTNPIATLNFIYPSVENVINGYFGAESGGCLPYAKNINEKQRWLQNYLHQWKADRLIRTKAMPHIKTYTRVSPCLTKLAYFLLTSANLSKSAWGGNLQRDQAVYVRSYEVGVLFLPEIFQQEHFEITSKPDTPTFPFMYDLPLIPYTRDDYPWCN